MWYMFIFLIGFGLAVSGGVTLIAYLNFLPAGISWGAYFQFISSRVECYLLPLGILLMIIMIYQFPHQSQK